jgi:hypothetical protein
MHQEYTFGSCTSAVKSESTNTCWHCDRDCGSDQLTCFCKGPLHPGRYTMMTPVFWIIWTIPETIISNDWDLVFSQVRTAVLSTMHFMTVRVKKGTASILLQKVEGNRIFLSIKTSEAKCAKVTEFDLTAGDSLSTMHLALNQFIDQTIALLVSPSITEVDVIKET